MDDYLLGKLGKDEAEAFEIYCSEHPEFLEEVRVREQLLRLIKEEGEALFTEDAELESSVHSKGERISIARIFKNRRARWFYAAAAIAAVIALVVIPRLIREEGPSRYAGNFLPSEHMESLMESVFRGGEIDISVLSPATGENFQGSVRFEWNARQEGAEFSGPFELVLLNNKEEEVFRREIEGRQFVLEKKLHPGLYYWTLDYGGETLSLGKFFIRKPVKYE